MVKRFRSYTQLRVKQVAKDRSKLPAVQDISKLNEVARILAQVDNKVHVLAKTEGGYKDEATGKGYTVESLAQIREMNRDHIYWIIN